MKKKSGKTNILFEGDAAIVATIRLAGVFIFYVITRLCLYFFSSALFPDIHAGEFLRIFLGGLRFDLSALLVVNAPYLFINTLPVSGRGSKGYRIVSAFLFFIPNALALVANLADTVYFRFTFKRMTGDFFSYMKAGGADAVNLLPQYIKDFWYVAVCWIVFLLITAWFYRKVRIKTTGKPGMKGILKGILLFVIINGLAIVGIRGGLQLKPVNIISAAAYAVPQNVPLVLNTPFSIMKTINQKEIRSVSYFKDEHSLDTVFTPVHHPGIINGKAPEFKPMNVVIIILESFSSENIGALNPDLEQGKYKGYTPFLDSLISQSLVFKGFANGKRSIEAIPAVVASLPSLMNNDYITSSYAGDKINSLASLLKAKGYQTAFYHGGNNGTMNFDAFAKMAGFEYYFGRKEYANEKDFDGEWGIYDEEYLQYFARNLDHTKQPFFTTIFTLSSHHPYVVLKRFPGRYPKGHNKLDESIGYTDNALRKYFATASGMSWFDNTLFVITGDHTSETWYPYYKTRAGMYSVPVIFYQHNSHLKGMGKRVVQQMDIMPSVLDYLGYDRSYIAFGSSVFAPAQPAFAISYLNNSYMLVQDNYALVFEEDKARCFYDLVKDPLQKENLIGSGNGKIAGMTDFLEAVIQQYNNRVITNRLTLQSGN